VRFVCSQSPGYQPSIRAARWPAINSYNRATRCYTHGPSSNRRRHVSGDQNHIKSELCVTRVRNSTSSVIDRSLSSVDGTTASHGRQYGDD